MIKDFWATVYRRDIDNSSFRNDTIDVFQKDCYYNRNNYICSGNLSLFILSCVILVFCFLRLVGFYNSRHSNNYYAYIIYSCAGLEVSLLAIKWAAIIWLYQMEFVASIMKMVQFVTLNYLNWSLVFYNLIQIRRLLKPLLGLFACFCTTIAVLAIYLRFSPWIQCLIPHWLITSVSEFICIQGYVLAGIFVTQQIKSMADEDIKQKQKRHLWSVILAYEVSCCLTLIYYVTLQCLGDEKIGCSGVFYHIPQVFTVFHVAAMFFRYLLPIIVTIIVMKPSHGYLNIETSFGRLDNSARPLINPNEDRSNSYEGTSNSNEGTSNSYQGTSTSDTGTSTSDCEKAFSWLFWDSCSANPAPPENYAAGNMSPSDVVVGQPTVQFSNTTINECPGERVSRSA